MIRTALLLLLVGLGFATLLAPQAIAQEGDGYEIKPDPNAAWENYSPNAGEVYYLENGQPSGKHQFKLNGAYFSIFKYGMFVILFLVWVRTADWTNRDAITIGLDNLSWNAIMVFPFLIGMPMLGFLVPVFWLSFPLACVTYAVPMLLYVKLRNKHVTIDERVLTKDHFRYLLSRVNIGVEKEKKATWQEGPPVNFKAMGGADDQENQANLVRARQSPGYVTGKMLFVSALSKRAERVMLDFTKENVATKYFIDGVWHDLPPGERETSDPMLVALKQMAALNPEDRRSKQEGKLQAEYGNKKYPLRLTTQGTKTGERAILQIAGNERKFSSLEDLGMREKMRVQLQKLLGAKQGLFVFSALPGGGLTTTVTVGMGATDRLLRDWRGTEEVQNKEPYIENVDIAYYDASKGESPATLMQTLLRKEPDGLLVRDIVNKETFDMVLEATNKKEKFIVTTARAKDAVEAVLRLMQLKPDPKAYAKALTGVLNVRLCRQLCEKCKEAYEPPPETLRKLGLPADRVTELYRQRQPPPPETPEAKEYEPCKNCAEYGYREQIGIFELLEITDKFREALLKQPQLDVLRKIARTEGYRTLQEEGIVLAAKGVTSVAEVSRALKA